MIAKNVTMQQLETALCNVNKQYDDNIIFKRFEMNGRRVNFTLTVKSSKGKGGRIGHTGRRIAAACWHCHGALMDEILKIAPDAVIQTNFATIDKNGGNWQDKNIGSMVQPMMYSEACDCGN